MRRELRTYKFENTLVHFNVPRPSKCNGYDKIDHLILIKSTFIAIFDKAYC
jgi:hypothetical protein